VRALSIVIASVEAARSIERSVTAFERACQGHDVELIVADASHDGTADIVASRFPGVKLLRFAAGTLAPLLWAEGYRASSGRIVAFSTGHCTPAVGWASAMCEGLAGGAAGVAAPLNCPTRRGCLTGPFSTFDIQRSSANGSTPAGPRVRLRATTPATAVKSWIDTPRRSLMASGRSISTGQCALREAGLRLRQGPWSHLDRRSRS